MDGKIMRGFFGNGRIVILAGGQVIKVLQWSPVLIGMATVILVDARFFGAFYDKALHHVSRISIFSIFLLFLVSLLFLVYRKKASIPMLVMAISIMVCERLYGAASAIVGMWFGCVFLAIIKSGAGFVAVSVALLLIFTAFFSSAEMIKQKLLCCSS